MVLATAQGRLEAREGADFFPLTVDVEERMYAAGKIPGSFFKREGRPSEKGILTARMIDRPRGHFAEARPSAVLQLAAVDREAGLAFAPFHDVVRRVVLRQSSCEA